MTKTIALAHESCMQYVREHDMFIADKQDLMRFAELVRADERAAPCDQCIHKGENYAETCVDCRHFYTSHFQSKG